MNSFDPLSKPLKILLSQIDQGQYALPEFQRDFVWEAGAVDELIQSILRNYPAGSLLFLKNNGEGFRVREFAGANQLSKTDQPTILVLDGQQRLTSLYQAFYGKGEHKYFIDIRELLESGDVEEAVWHETTKKSESRGYMTLAYQSEHLLCPIEVILNDVKGGYDAWADEVVEHRGLEGEARKQLKMKLQSVNKQWLQQIHNYNFPVVLLSEKTELDAVCKMFETLNRRGVKLTVFELLMARSFSNNVSLRKMWEDAREEHPALREFDIDPVYVLQVINLLEGHGIKRSEILKMETSLVTKHWDSAIVAFADSIEFLQKSCGVLWPKLLPYSTMVITLAASWAATSGKKGASEGRRRDQFKQWFWASVFSQAYEKGQSSRVANDFKTLTSWSNGSEVEPLALRQLYFRPEMFFDIGPKQQALYQGTLALSMANGARDFYKGDVITFDYLSKNNVDDHHIFPDDYMKGKASQSRVDCVLNRTLIDRKTNISITNKAPAKYIGDMITAFGEEPLGELLDSHFINREALMRNDFESFLKLRAESLLAALEKQLGRPVPLEAPIYSIDDEVIDGKVTKAS